MAQNQFAVDFAKFHTYFRGDGRSDQERIFSLEWQKRSAAVYGVAGMYMMAAFHFGSAILGAFDAFGGAPMSPSFFGSLVSLIIVVGWLFIHRAEKSKSVYFFLYTSVAILTMLTIAHRINTFHDQSEYLGHLPAAAHIGYSMMVAATIALIPSRGMILSFFLLILSITILHKAWTPYGDDAWPAIRLAMIFLIGGFIFHLVLSVKSSREARREFQARALLDNFEKARLNNDLLLARRIQDSLSAYNNNDSSPFITKIYHRRYSQIGGDWVALRRDRSRALYVLVADAAGKGVQAALVLHSVQALWAESLGNPHFDPEGWLKRVNSALCQLGTRKPHMLTLGIAKFSYNTCSYYSAGHLPLFLVTRTVDSDPDDVKILLAPGTPVGLIEELTIGHASYACGEDFLALLGSDGFFQSGSHQKRNAILRLKDRLQAGEDVLDHTGKNGDDQTLVWISRTRYFKPA
jgi:serine phosphatase RsbU (regulator of sigma subunit)